MDALNCKAVLSGQAQDAFKFWDSGLDKSEQPGAHPFIAEKLLAQVQLQPPFLPK